ncbi:Arm DNA-binding domain-containing protein [Xenorhabdus sp. XENO-1]|nr:Arm DNA-binding domain-containing protein [Xenorhabdus bovienii]MCP9267240.1 Arm DNA-binding domain-containing protein [Xenorhabdus bovienii subsp. africana]
MISLGIYPVVTLNEARTKRDEARKLVANGLNPSEVRKTEKISAANLIENTFENITHEWYEKRVDRWLALFNNQIDRFSFKVIGKLLG